MILFQSWYIKSSTCANTSLCVCKGKNVVMIRDGQVTQGAESSNLMCEKFIELRQMSLVALQVHWLLPFYLSNKLAL